MVGALLLKRAFARGYAAISRQDLDAIADIFHEDAVFDFPGETVMSGRFEGRQAVQAWFERWFASMPETRFHPSASSGREPVRAHGLQRGPRRMGPR